MPQPAQKGGELSTPPAVCPRRMRVLRHERVQAGLTQGAVRGSIGCPSVMVATSPAVQKKVRFVTNTGSGFTIIPPELHHPGTGTLIPSDISLMSWGSKDRLAVRGNFTTQLMTVRGGATITILAEKDALALGFIRFYGQGRGLTEEELSYSMQGHTGIVISDRIKFTKTNPSLAETIHIPTQPPHLHTAWMESLPTYTI